MVLNNNANILGFYNEEDNISVEETKDENINMSVTFVKHNDRRNQPLLIDSNPDDLFYNPSTKTLHADNFSGGIPSLLEGEAIKLTTANNSTTIDVNFSKNTDVITTLSDSDTILISNTSNELKTIRADKLKEDISTEYAFAGPNLATSGTNISLNPTLAGLTSVSIRNDNSECLLLKTQNSSFLKECSITLSKNNTNSQTNFGIRFDGLNLKFGSVNNVLNGTLTEYMRLNSTELLVAGNAHLTTGHNFKIANSIICQSTLANTGVTKTGGVVRVDIASCAASSGLVATDIFILQTNADPAVSKRITGAQLISGINTNTEYTPGTNINIPANNSINLNTTLTGLNSVSSTNNTDLKLQSTGNGDILLKANATNTTVGKILLSRIDNDAIRFNTIEYGNNANLSYIKFLVHRDDNTNTLTREVLKLNSDLSSTFAGSVTASSFIGTAGNNLDIKTTTNNDIIFSQNNNSIMKISSTGITALNSKTFFGSFSGTSITSPLLKTSVGSITISSGFEIVSISDSNGDNGGAGFVWQCKRTAGGSLVELLRLQGSTGNLTGQGTFSLPAVSNTAISTIHTAKIGCLVNSGFAGFRHKDSTSTYGYALLQDAVGSTTINSALNKQLILGINNNAKLVIASSGNISITNDLTISGELNVPTISGASFISTIHTLKLGCVFANNFAGIRHKDANNTTGYALIQGGDGSTYVNSAGTKPLRFRIANVTKMEISALGKVGIGKTPTARDLDVLGPISSDDAFQLNGVDVVRNEGLSEGTNVWVNCRLLQNRSALSQDGMYINYDSTGTSNLRFYAGGTSKRMEIFTNGRVAINTASPTEMLHVTGNIRASGIIQLGGIRAGYSGGITYNSLGGTGSANQIGFKWGSPNIYGRVDNVLSMVVGTASDRRIKRNIKNITDDESRKFLDLIQPRSYNSAKYVVDGIEISCDCDEIIYGGVAQEIEENFPELVLSEGEDGLKSLYNDQISFLTLSSLQMVDKTVTELKKENEELKNKVNELELKLDLIIKKLNM